MPARERKGDKGGVGTFSHDLTVDWNEETFCNVFKKCYSEDKGLLNFVVAI